MFKLPATNHQPLNTKSGFTLIELLIVVAILGVLATFGLATFPASQGRARDTQRRSDLGQYRVVLETYANNNNGNYPTYNAQTQPLSTNLCDPTRLNLNPCPQDPRDNTNNCTSGTCRYYYRSDGSGGGGASATMYVLYARLERPTATTSPIYIVCSNGKSGEHTTVPSSGACPL